MPQEVGRSDSVVTDQKVFNLIPSITQAAIFRSLIKTYKPSTPQMSQLKVT